MHARKLLLFGNGKEWIKKGRDSEFDVTMGSYDGPEICELVGAFILNELGQHLNKASIGLYRDDGLAVLKNTSGSAIDRIRKIITSVFKSLNLRITIDVNLKVVNLDVTFSLARRCFPRELKYVDSKQGENTDKKKNRGRNIIWFNPPYSRTVTTNIAATF